MILDRIDRVREVEKVAVDGEECRQLKFEVGEHEWFLALEPSDPPVARQLKWALPSGKAYDATTKAASEVSSNLTLKFKNWDFRPKPTDHDFEIEIPDDWKRVEDALDRN